MALLELDQITKNYADQPGGGANGVNILDGIDLTLQAGESLAVIGPSGCGKSTLLNIIGALDTPTSGTVKLDGRALTGMDEPALAEIRNRRIGFVFQQHHLLPQCTVLENVLVPTLAGRRNAARRREDADRAAALLEQVGLAGKRAHLPGHLSGGEAQRTAVARALINRPALLLADEPTGSLDQATARALGDLLLEVNRNAGTAMLVVTHSNELAQRMQAVRRLSHGKFLPEC